MESLTGTATMILAPEWASGLLSRMGGSGWLRLAHLLLVALACVAILGAMKLVTRAVRRWIAPAVGSHGGSSTHPSAPRPFKA